MTAPGPGSSFLARAAIGLWWCGIGALAFLQFYLRASGPAGFAVDTVAWLWLSGAVVVTAVGAALVLRAARQRPPR